MGTIVCAVASLLVVATLFAGPLEPMRLLLIALVQIVAIGLAIMARHAMARHLAALDRLIESDPATGCLNRRGFARAMKEALTEAARTERDARGRRRDRDGAAMARASALVLNSPREATSVRRAAV